MSDNILEQTESARREKGGKCRSIERREHREEENENTDNTERESRVRMRRETKNE
jgi:hypothetical protein